MIDIILLLILALAAGLLGSLTGLGGSAIMIPLLVLFGVPVKYAIAASMVAIIATSSGSASSYVRDELSNIRAAFYLEIFTVIGAIIGATITSVIAPVYLYFFFSLFLLSSFLAYVRGHAPPDTGNLEQDRFSRWLGLEGKYYDASLGREVQYKMTNPALGGLGMLVAGLAAGMLGIGAGVFKVSIHELILKMPTKVSTATSNFIIGMTALAGSSVYFSSGLFFVNLAAPLAVGTTVGAMLGARVLGRLQNKMIRYIFMVVLVFIIIEMLYKGVSSL